MDATILLTHYQRILGASQKMHQLASSEAWDALIDCEVERRHCIADLRHELQMLPEVNLPIEQQEIADNCIREVLTLDQKTRDLAERWMNELGKDLQTVSTAQRLRRTYLTP